MSLFNLIALGSSNSRRTKTIKVNAAPLAGNYTPGGLALDFTTITDPTFQGSCFPGSVPTAVQVDSSPAGYSAEAISLAPAAPTLSNSYALKIYTAPGVEMTAIAIPASLVADAFLLSLAGPNWGF
jgi:hypothetical protein